MPSVATEQFRPRKEKTPEDLLHSTLQDLDKRFSELTEQLESWSEETAKVMRSLASPRNRTLGLPDLDLVKTILGKWSIHIIQILYSQERVGFAELRKGLKGIGRWITMSLFLFGGSLILFSFARNLWLTESEN